MVTFEEAPERPARRARAGRCCGRRDAWQDGSGPETGHQSSSSPVRGAGRGQRKIPAGGFDTATRTLEAIKAGQLDFTINQDPYMQGFLPVLYLYTFNLTGGLVLPPDTDTGLSFVTSSNIGPYLNSSTTYVGSTGATKPTLVPRSGPISAPSATMST